MDRPNRIADIAEVRGQRAYIYGLKERARDHHCMGWGTFSADLTELEALRKEYSRRIRPITYPTLYAKATALAVQRHPEANSVLFRKPFGRRIVRFQNVDVNLPITRRLGSGWITFIGTVRDAPNKSLADIQHEITAYVRCPPAESFSIQRTLRFAHLPLWAARLIHARLTWDPAYYMRNVGTCGFTLAEDGAFEHGLPIGPTSAIFGIGGAHREPVVRGDQVVIRRVLKGSLMVDNFVVSGLTGAKLMRDFKELIETGSFIREEL